MDMHIKDAMPSTRFATLSDGGYLEPLNSFKKHRQRLARYQRAMSRKVKFSNNWKKAKTQSRCSQAAR
jgi:putative transposase